MLTMNLAPGKFDLRFKWIFILKHRCYLEIITADGSYAFNKWPRWKVLSGERRFSPAGFALSRFSSTPPPWFTTQSFNPFSLEIKVSSCLCSSFTFLAPLANYSICLPQNYFPQFPAYSWCPNITTYFLVSALLAVGWQHTYPGKWLFFAVKRCDLFTTYSASY